MKKRLLIVGPGSQRFRSYILKRLVEQGFELFIAGDDQAIWATGFASDFCSLTTPQALYEFGRQHKIHGILTYSEVHVPVVAEAARLLELVGLDPSAALKFRNKFLMRQALAKTGITSIQSFIAQTPQEAVEYGQRIGFPLVVKPTWGHSSIGVVKAWNEQDVIHASKQALHIPFDGHSPSVIVEEYLDGPEVSMECFVENGQPTVVAITDKRLSAEPFFEEIGHTIPSKLSSTTQCLLVSLALRALIALELHTGIAHVEARLTSQGPKVIEIGARLAGDFIPLLLELATGIDLPMIAASLACGLPVDIGQIREEAASVAFIIPAQEGIVHSANGFPELYANIVKAECWAEAGQEVHLPPKHYLTRLGYVITKEASADRALKTALAALNTVELTIV